MKLISARHSTKHELKHAFSAEEAMPLVKQHLDTRQTIDGLDHLRSFLALNFEFEVLNQVTNGDWLLIKPEAYYFDYAPFEERIRESRVMALMHSAPPQIRDPMKVLRVIASETDEPLVSRRYIATIDGERGERRVDALGVGQIPEPAKGSKISMRVIIN